MAEDLGEQFDDFGFGFEEGNEEEQNEEESSGFGGGGFDDSADGFDDADGFGDGFDEEEVDEPVARPSAPTPKAPTPKAPTPKAAAPKAAAPKAAAADESEYDGDPNVKPKAGKLSEEMEHRSHDQVGMTWESFSGQVVNTLRIQIMPARVGFDQGYQSAMGKEVSLRV
jgi:pyruvate/2-oxoglutarate dehydrogenase complex dihydrolipoamide acyltransferase (E2) component